MLSVLWPLIGLVSGLLMARRGYDPKTRPVLHLMKELTARKGLSTIKIEKPGLKLELNGGK